jgi:hypothetical protein
MEMKKRIPKSAYRIEEQGAAFEMQLNLTAEFRPQPQKEDMI